MKAENIRERYRPCPVWTKKLEKEIRDLKYKLKEEVTVENFEEAAKLRDTIKKLQKNYT